MLEVKSNVCLYFILVFALVNLSTTALALSQESNEDRLKKVLFPSINAGQHTKPTMSLVNGSVEVQLIFDIAHIRTLDEASGIYTISGMLKMTWFDERYIWNASEYGDVSHIILPYTSMWTPDVSNYNSAEPMDKSEYAHSTLFLTEGGLVNWTPHVTFSTVCPMTHRLFPFDNQTCNLIIGSWSQDTNDIRLVLGYEHVPYIGGNKVPVLDVYSENPQWDLRTIEASAENFEWDECCSEPFKVIEYRFFLWRRAELQKYLFLTPCIVAFFLNLALFWMPPSSPERLHLGGVVIILEIMFLLLLGFFIPKGGYGVPVFIVCSANLVAITAATIVTTILVVNIARSPCCRRPLPNKLKNGLKGILGRLCCIQSTVWDLSLQQKLIDDGHEMRPAQNQNDAEQGSRDSTDSIKTEISDWIAILTLLDRACFLWYLATVAYASITVLVTLS